MSELLALRWYAADTAQPGVPTAAPSAEPRGLVIEALGRSGVVGRGEASPLPGYSPDTLDEVRRELARASLALGAVAATPPEPWWRLTAPRTLGASLASLAPLACAVRSPAARFGLETALADLVCRDRGQSLASFIAGSPQRPRTLMTTAVCRTSDEVAAALAAGVATIKLKIGGDARAAAELAARVAAQTLAATATLRLDANQQWDEPTYARFCALLGDIGAAIEFIEEPVRGRCENAALPLAADERLWTLAQGLPDDELPALAARLAAENYRTLVLKPTCLGGLHRSKLLATAAHELGMATVVTHTFDGVIATRAAAELAAALGDAPLAAGVGAHAALRDTLFCTSGLAAGRAEVAGRAGHGAWPAATATLDLRLAAADDERLALVITTPAGRAPDGAPAPDASAPPSPGAWSFAALAAALGGRNSTCAPTASPPPRLTAAPVVADTSLATCLAIYRALGGGAPLALLHPAWTERERAVALRALRDAACASHGELVVFSSGSTGAPRGIWLTTGSLAHSARASAQHLGLHQRDRWYAPLSLAHVGGLSVLTRCLAARATAVLAAPTADGARLADDLDAHEITLASLVPTQLARLFAQQPHWRAPPALRAVILGGAAAPAALLREARRRGLRVLTSYGMTETCAQVVCAPYADAAADAAAAARGAGVGRPLPGVDLSIRDGRIAIGGQMIATHALEGALERTIDGYLLTRDAGTLTAAGDLHVSGRLDDAFVVGGETIDPVEIEAVARELHGVAEACAFGVADDSWGATVALAIAPAADFDPAALRLALAQSLAEGKRPRLLAVLETLPLTANGKLDRLAVKADAQPRLQPL